jgi:hypothetical protein
MSLAYEQEGPITFNLGLVPLPAALLGWTARQVGAAEH